MKSFRLSFFFTLACLAAAAVLGYGPDHSAAGALNAVFICAVLGVMEVSLSFDNAVVNASILGTMGEVWRRRFLTWGVLIAVFGMRLVFPLLIVGVTAHLNPSEAVTLAATRPDDYARMLAAAHVGISGFGGAFLMMVGLKFFFDEDKEIHWIAFVERRLQFCARLEAFEVAVVLLVLYAVSRLLPDQEALTFLIAGAFGLVAYIAVEAIGTLLEKGDGEATMSAARAGLGAFLYLEMLDASFSFDGVIGAFALSTNLFIIALGLGIGAMFVRSLTVMLVEKGALSEYRYLEHGAFWAILALAGLMFAQVRWHIPEAITGLVGAGLIGLALLSSILHRRAHPELVSPNDVQDAPSVGRPIGTAIPSPSKAL